MDSLGRAIYMACFALMFIVAASISIYLYGTLNTYLEQASNSTAITNRTEGIANEDLLNFKRDISVSEIYITLFNMTQMHVTSLTVNGITVTENDVLNSTSTFRTLLRTLETLAESNAKFTYSYSGSAVTYSS